MSAATDLQYNPQREIDNLLVRAGASKTVYALVTPETETTKNALLGSCEIGTPDSTRAAYLDMFRAAWTKKQDAAHHEFFDTWVEWAKPLVNLNREDFPFYYPCNGASEPLRHLIYKYGCDNAHPIIHIFKGEYEGYKAFAADAHIRVIEHDRDNWADVTETFKEGDLFFISQPSAIDGNVWLDFNRFAERMSRFVTPSIVADLTYVGAIADEQAVRFDMTIPSIRNVVFSLSKPFGAYYDRIGGIFSREEDGGLFGNAWFKNLTSLALGTRLLKTYDVFHFARKYAPVQQKALEEIGAALGLELSPADVYILATAKDADPEIANYLRRQPNGLLRVCLTPAMAKMIGTA